MPLRVHCPTGCLIHMSANRCGKIVRCPKCKLAIRIPIVPESELATGQFIACDARIAIRKTDVDLASGETPQHEMTPSEPAKAGVETRSLETAEPEQSVAQGGDESPKHRLPIPELAHSIELRRVGRSKQSGTPAETSTIPVIELGALDQEGFDSPDDRNWEERLKNANSDRKLLAKLFALCLCFVAIVNMVPALYHWYHWHQIAEAMPLPRWIYILVFVGAIHLVYAVFLIQILDWSAMRAVSITMLIVAFVFGVVSTALLIGGGEGDLTEILGIPYTLNRQACIWCVAMLCLATLMSYWGGKESSHWQRAEYLLQEILKKSPASELARTR